MDITGKVALVTGAAIRVGRETAMELARAGADILIHYRSSEAEAAVTADAIRSLGRKCVIVQADFTQPGKACDRILAAIDEHFAGRCDILVNNASAYTPGSPESLSPRQWADLIAVNVTTPTMLAERVGERMIGGAGFQPANGSAGFQPANGSAGFQPAAKEAQVENPCYQETQVENPCYQETQVENPCYQETQVENPCYQSGVIVNMLDIQARRPWKRYLACAMTAGAMWTATVGLARRFAPLVRVNGVAPGTVLWNEQDEESMRQRVIELTPLKRIGCPGDVAKAVRFLIENDYITGQVLCVDGGRSMC